MITKGAIAHIIPYGYKMIDLPNLVYEINLSRPVKYKAGLLFSLVIPIYIGKQCNEERSEKN